jgi:hypothetical protein
MFIYQSPRQAENAASHLMPVMFQVFFQNNSPAMLRDKDFFFFKKNKIKGVGKF